MKSGLLNAPAPATQKQSPALKPHLRSMARYMCTIPNLMDYVRIIIYFFAVHAHFAGIWWAMPATIIVNGVIDDFDGKVARYLDQCSTMGYLVDCAADNLAVVTNTACIACAAMTSSTLPPQAQWAICIAMQLYAMFFISWSCLATAIPNYKGNHHTALAKWYYGTTIGDFVLYLGMQSFWCSLYLFVEGTHAQIGLNALAVTIVPFVLKVFVECENVYFLILAVMEKDIKTLG